MALLPEGILAHTMTGDAPGRHGNHDALWSPHAVYRCAGPDRWVSIAVAHDDEWRRLAGVVDPALAADARFATAADRKRNEQALDALLGEWCASRTPEEVTAALQGAGVAAFPAMTAKDLNDDPHLGGRDYFVDGEVVLDAPPRLFPGLGCTEAVAANLAHNPDSPEAKSAAHGGAVSGITNKLGSWGSTVGAVAGSLKFREASTMLTLIDNRSGVQLGPFERGVFVLDER